ncbi:MAG: LytTR family transcriptional regulator DNA-binding domain-containing protein [Lachnospiraceae bacterium]
MSNEAYMPISQGKRKTKVDKSTILYAIAKKKYVEVHVHKDYVFKTSTSFAVVEELLGEGFVEVKRGLIVSERAIDYIADTIHLVNGEELDYTIRRKREIVEKLRQNKKLQIVMTKRGIYQIANQGEMPMLNLAAHNIMNPAGSTIPKRIRASRKAELDRIRKLLATKKPELEEEPEPCICFQFKKKEYRIAISTILYVTVKQDIVYIHTIDGNVYRERISLRKMGERLGDGFLKINTSTLVAVRNIREISDKIWLCNGEGLSYIERNKRKFMKRIVDEKKKMAERHAGEDIPRTEEEYREYYRGFEHMPFAFADIEMVFDDSFRAVDWIFRYGNPALAKLEKLPLHVLIGSAFGDLFYNMDSKWLESYERAALYGETLEILDYSPEIDTNLKVICFQTFVGHCGCILFNVDEMK